MARLSHEFRFAGRFRAALRRSSSAFGLLAFVGFSALLADAQSLPSNPQPSFNCAVSSTMFKGFFQGGTAAVNGVVNPANSVSFTNNTGLKNCDFYQWAQQMFLWLTSPTPPTYGGGGGRIFASPQFYTVTPADTNGKRTLISNKSMFSILGPGILQFAGVRAAQVGLHGLPVIMSKSGQMFEVQPGPVSKAGNPLVLNSAGKQVEVSRAETRNGQLVLLDTKGKPIAKPKLIVPRQIPVEQLQRLRPQQQQLQELAPQHEMLLKLAPQRENETQIKLTAAHLQVLQKLQPAPVNSKLIAQRFVINGRNIFLNVSGGVIETEEGQAVTDGVLLAQNGSLIYYITMVNDVMAYFLTGVKDTLLSKPGIPGPPTQFPTSATELAPVTTFALAHGLTPMTITDPTCASAITATTSPFPDPCALAIEVKSSWIETSGISDPSQYITTQAVVPTFDTSNPNQWVPNGHKTATLALVGMHVVGSASGHHEMIWATFEHFGNAPNDTFKFNAVTGPNPNTVMQNTSGTWLFCASGASTGFNMAHATFSSPNIVGSPVASSNVLRSSAFGASLGVRPNPLVNVTNGDADSNSQVIGIDNSIMQGFAPLSGGPDIRTNYYMTGATWTENGAPPSGSFPPGNAVGTSRLAGSTMETFQQPSNCLDCHATNQLNVSHVTCQAGSNMNQCLNGIQPLF